jgi:hypothetical protein
MSDLIDNNVIRFINITKKKEGMFANFKVKGQKGGTSFKASISVDIAALDINLAEDPVEKVIESCARMAVREFKRSEYQFEGLAAI